MTNKKGQTLIEFIITSFAVIPFMTLLLFLSYVVYSDQITSYIHYRTLHCVEELNKTSKVCERDANKKINTLLYFHSSVKTSVLQKKNKNKVVTVGKLFSYKLKYTKSLKLSIK